MSSVFSWSHIGQVAWIAALAGGGCASSAPPAPAERPQDAASAVKPAPLASCTWETPLDPTVPGSPDHPIPSSINPNGDSELAALMRGMDADARAAREALLGGRRPPAPQVDHSHMPCAWPTDPTTRSAVFQAYAVTYLAAWDALHAAPDTDAARAQFAGVLSTCVSCHEQYCQGPIERIQAMSLP